MSCFIPQLIALRVVSLPATARRMKNDPNSDGVSRWPSTSACINVDTMSSRGWSRRSWPSSWAYVYMPIAAASRASNEPPKSGSPAPRMTLVQSNTACSSAAGTPSMSQMICSGSGAANACTKSHSPRSAASATSWRARTRTLCSMAATVLGVKPFCTSRRSLEWRGSSRTIIDPKNSRASGKSSDSVMPPVELKIWACRLTVRTSSYRVTDQNPGPCGAPSSTSSSGWNATGQRSRSAANSRWRSSSGWAQKLFVPSWMSSTVNASVSGMEVPFPCRPT